MTRFRRAILTITAWLIFTGSASAQRTPLYGSIRGSDHMDRVPISFVVHITAELANQTRPFPSRNSRGPSFAIMVPTNATINLTFQSEDYEPYTVEGISTAGIDSNDGYQVPPIPVTLTRIYGSKLTATEAKIRLLHARAIAIATGAIDLFFYNLEVLRDAFQNDLAITAEIKRFETEMRGDEHF